MQALKQAIIGKNPKQNKTKIKPQTKQNKKPPGYKISLFVFSTKL